MPRRMTPRRAEALALRRQGLTLAAVGERLGVSRERARQLVKRALEVEGGEGAAALRHDRRAEERQRLAQRRAQWERVAALCDLAEAWGLTVRELGRVEGWARQFADLFVAPFPHCARCRDTGTVGQRFPGPCPRCNPAPPPPPAPVAIAGGGVLGPAMEARRVALGLTVREVSIVSGVETWRNFERGLARTPRPETAERIERALGWERGTVVRLLAG